MTVLRRLLLLVVIVVGAAPTARARDIFSTQRDPIPPEVERTYVKGLRCLVSTQRPNGCWGDSYGSQPGVVGLALMAMLAHGEDPNFGPYKEPIKKAIDFILSHANKTNGYIGSSMYNHGFATLALAESYGTVNDPRIGPALQQAVDFLLTVQKSNSMGAWRYSPSSADADTTVSGACLVALMAARNAGILVPEEAIKKALNFYRNCQSGDGGFGYTNAGGSNAPRSAIGALVFCLAKKKDTDTFKRALNYIKAVAMSGEGGYYQGYHFYNLYYMSQAVFQGNPKGWDQWNQVNVKRLQTTQQADGSWTGSYGVSFSTAAALLSMALNYRFLPIYER